MSSNEKSLLATRFRGFLPVVIDVETGGFNAKTDALLEIGAVTVAMDDDGILHVSDSYHFHVTPFEGANLEKEALEFTGIDPYHPFRNSVDEKDALTDIFNPIRQQIKDEGCTRAILVGHNAVFDHDFVKAAASRQGIKRNPFHPFSCFDTATLAGLAVGQTVLAKACRAANIPFDNREAHSAIYDAKRTAELFCYIVNRWQQLGGLDGIELG